MQKPLPYIGRKARGADLWIMPASWRGRWRASGGRVVRQATPEEDSAFIAFHGAGCRPQSLSKVMTAFKREPAPVPETNHVPETATEVAEPVPTKRKRKVKSALS